MNWKEKLPEYLAGHYACTRDWSAWNYGTMRRDDFIPLEECDEVISDFEKFIFTEIIEKLIVDIPENIYQLNLLSTDQPTPDSRSLKQHLKDKWLNN